MQKFLAGLKLGYYAWLRKLAYRFERLLFLQHFGICYSCTLNYKILYALQDYLKLDQSISKSALNKYWRTWEKGGIYTTNDALKDESQALKELFKHYNVLITKWYYIFGGILTVVVVLGYLLFSKTML